MAGIITRTSSASPATGATSHPGGPVREPAWVRRLLIGVGVGFLLLFLLMPLVAIFHEAFKGGARLYFATFEDPFARHAIRMTLIVAAISVPLNLLFGLAAAWAITKFTFRGKSLLVTVLDLPFAVSPVIAGLMFVLIFSTTHGWLAEPIRNSNIQIIFALPGIALATIFITLPFIARELIPLMQAQGRDEEYAALTLGAGGWRTFVTVTLPNVKWGLFYGVILCNARAMGEFGAVSVVSGNIKGRTSTMPLYIETLYFEYQSVAAFALASLLSLLAVATLALKNLIEWRAARARLIRDPDESTPSST